jgi:hypothetical protein
MSFPYSSEKERKEKEELQKQQGETSNIFSSTYDDLKGYFNTEKNPSEQMEETSLDRTKKPNLGVKALDALANFGKGMSSSQSKIESPKFNSIDTKVNENSDLVAIKKAILARMAGR